ncbi:Glycosyl transferase family 2 OS=Calothrix sp. PCC 7507 GN=Cal7507_5339 PE=4 SV=1 [Gemmataceae bacterium]|nr:Glycosyl transferase family 2 OS=Calothrix sp. PCC 7507 GN=Cal7507_5339 PE=4 SV=1 [Gemmataceae bacterium]VTU02605.1 Glycosyl transferase family 2 OS=Calothrix sp. PCC 7507 GN=Cal7507_5339 PE=4 SV=1 [Gemmataceae bacterium]
MSLLFSQDDLAALCRERPVFPGEYHIQNELYGLHRLLGEYAGLPADRPLPWAMEHAITFGSPEPYEAELATPLPIRLAITEEQAAALRARGGRPVHAIGSAYFYMRELFARRYGESAPPRAGTIVFPDKSTTHQDTDYDRDRFAADLAALPDEYQPVAVSVFWRDWQRGCHEPFARAGLRLVTSGHPYDPLFLFRQHDLCRRFRYACSNDLSTSFCLSVLSGCRFFHRPTGGLTVTRGGVASSYPEEPTLQLPGKRECVAAAPFQPASSPDLQVRLAERYAGRASVRPPEFFRRLYDEGHRALLSLPAGDQDFDAPGPAHRLAAWRGWGIDADGWARAAFGFTTPAGPCGVRLELDVLPGAVPEWPLAEVRAGGESLALRLVPGRVAIEVPGGCDVEIRGSAEFPLGPRHRGLRVVRVARLARAASRAWSWPGEPPAPRPADFRDGGPKGWITQGVDTDGWCAIRCRATGKVPAGFTAARLRLRVPPRAKGVWGLRCGRSVTRVAVGPGEWDLIVPVVGGLVDVLVESDWADTVSEVDQRVRSFLLLSASWQRSNELCLRPHVPVQPSV